MENYYTQTAQCQVLLPSNGAFLPEQSQVEENADGKALLEWAGPGWDQGNQADLTITKKPTKPWGLRIEFPAGCEVGDVVTWHACLVEDLTDLENGVVELEQVNWQLEKDSIGFSMNMKLSQYERGERYCLDKENYNLTVYIRENGRKFYNTDPDHCIKSLQSLDSGNDDNYGYKANGDQQSSRLDGVDNSIDMQRMAHVNKDNIFDDGFAVELQSAGPLVQPISIDSTSVNLTLSASNDNVGADAISLQVEPDMEGLDEFGGGQRLGVLKSGLFNTKESPKYQFLKDVKNSVTELTDLVPGYRYVVHANYLYMKLVEVEEKRR